MNLDKQEKLAINGGIVCVFVGAFIELYPLAIFGGMWLAYGFGLFVAREGEK